MANRRWFLLRFPQSVVFLGVHAQQGGAVGLVPVVRTVAQSSEFIKNTPVRKLAVDELAYAKWVPTMPGAGEFLDTVLEYVGQAAQGRMASKDALEEAAVKVQPILDRNK